MTVVDDEQTPPPGRRAAARRRRLRLLGKVLVAAVGIGVVALAVLLLVIWIWWRFDPSDGQRSRGVNALWAAHTWVGDEHSRSEYRDFAALLQRNEISDVFVHAGPLDGDGSVPDDRIAHAPELIAAMKQEAPGVRVQAYLGQVARRGGGPLDLGDDEVRNRILVTAAHFLDLGFGGIHYDIEPVYPGDQRFLDLLERTHELTQARGAVLSVALEQPEPFPGAQRVIGTFWRSYNDPTMGFLRQVAARVDQVAIMTYDTGLPTDWMFGADVAWQTERVVRAIGDDITVFMGVPTYDKGTFLKFHSWAENVRSGIRGIRKGLDRVGREHSQRVGVALFAEWTTSEDEWQAYADGWLPK